MRQHGDPSGPGPDPMLPHGAPPAPSDAESPHPGPRDPVYWRVLNRPAQT